MKLAHIPIIVLGLLSHCLHSQTDYTYNQFDSLGFKHGLWEHYCTNSFEPGKNSFKALFKIAILYDHGQCVDFSRLTDSYRLKNKYKLILEKKDGTIEVLDNKSNPDIITFISGKLVKLNKAGDTCTIEYFECGRPVGKTIYRHQKYRYDGARINYESKIALDSAGYEITEKQQGNGAFTYHGVVDKKNGLWGYFPISNDSYVEEKSILFYTWNSPESNVPPAMPDMSLPKFMLNDTFFLDFNERSVHECVFDSDTMKISSITTDETSEKIEIVIPLSERPIAIRFNHTNGKQIQIEQVEYAHAILETAQIRKEHKWRYYPPEKQFILDVERSYNKRQQKRILRKLNRIRMRLLKRSETRETRNI